MRSRRKFTREFKLDTVQRLRVEETRIAELERKIGQQVLEIDFLKRALQLVEQQRQLRAASGGAR